MSDSGGIAIPRRNAEVVQRARRLRTRLRALGLSAAISDDPRAQTVALGTGIAGYLSGRIYRGESTAPFSRLGRAMLELWDPVSQEPDVSLAMSLATIISTTSHDHVDDPSPRLNARVQLALGIAAAFDDANDAWAHWWQASVELARETRIDLGAIHRDASFWAILRSANLTRDAFDSLVDSPGPGAEEFARMNRALEAAGRADDLPQADQWTEARLDSESIDVEPTLDANAPRIKVLFATNREPAASAPSFTGEVSPTTHFGSCDVQVPDRAGARPPTPMRDFRYSGASIFPRESDFFHAVRDNIDKTDRPRRCLVFIHGYRTGFDSSIVRAAQLAHDLQYEGHVAVLSWPSAGRWLFYGRDAQRVDLAAPILARFLVELTHAGMDRIDLIVHSLGNRLFASAADQMAARGAPSLGSVFLAAADIESPRFDQLASTLASLTSEPVSLYVSRRDLALLASRVTFNQTDRVGRGDPIRTADGVSTIDATEVRSGDVFGHDYFANTASLLADIAAQLGGALVPDQRGEKPLKATTPAGEPYWRFPRKRP